MRYNSCLEVLNRRSLASGVKDCNSQILIWKYLNFQAHCCLMLPLQNLDFLKSETYPLLQCQDTLSSSGAKNLKIRLETDLYWYYFNFMNIVKFFMLLNTLILNEERRSPFRNALCHLKSTCLINLVFN